MSLTNIFPAQSAIFNEYLSKIGFLQERLAVSKVEYEKLSGSHIKDKTEKKDKGDDYKYKKHYGQELLLFDKSSKSSLGDEKDNQSGISVFKSTKRGSTPYRTEISTIPNVYFEDSFHLENPRTFDVVSEWAEVAPRHNGFNSIGLDELESSISARFGRRKALSTNAIIQEKLSWYMDTVEIHLISSISNASTSFFSALGSLRSLQQETEESISKIKRIREELARLNQNVAYSSLRIAKMQRRKTNLQKLLHISQHLLYITNGISRCETLIDEDALDAALDLAKALQLSLSTDMITRNAELAVPHLFGLGKDKSPLGSLEVVSKMQNDLEEVKRRIGRGYETRFLDLVLRDLRSHLKSMPPKDVLQMWAVQSQRNRGEQSRSQSLIPSYLQIHDDFRSSLLHIVRGLYYSGMATSAIAVLREAVVREIKILIRKNLPSSSDDDTESIASVSTRSGRRTTQQERSAILARNLRALEPEAAEDLLVQSYTSVGEMLRRLGAQLKVLLDVTSRINGDETVISATESKSPGNDCPITYNADRNQLYELQQSIMEALDMSGLLGKAVDAAQTQIIKLLKVRSEQCAQLQFSYFLRYITINRFFADECEGISGRSSESFKSIVNSHIKEFVAMMGNREKQRLAQSMELDKWEPHDFGKADLSRLSKVLQAADTDAVSWIQSTHVWEDAVKADDEKSQIDVEKEISKSLFIDNQPFILVKSISIVLSGVENFEHLLVVVPYIANEVCYVLADYLRLFNSRCYQLILGAGATKSAGLKNINTKHLALALQSLSFIEALVPYVKSCITRHRTSSTSSIIELEKVQRLYYEHKTSIQDKLIDIMNSRSATHVNEMQSVDWDNDLERPVSQYMETITKETTTLYRVLNKNLPEVLVKKVMSSVFSKYREHWGKAFQNAHFRTEVGKSRLVIFLTLLGINILTCW